MSTSSNSKDSSSDSITFADLALSPEVMKAVEDVGYEQPSPIQAQCIPAFLDGQDILGVAQTGTGKTAAFALPLLSLIDLDALDTQVLVLAPTRELAMQVAEAFETYAKYIDGVSIAAIYGGASIEGQLRQLRRGAHIVVGTPGRVTDHIKRKTLKLSNVNHVVLDEADEMLRMGFIDDVEWILAKTPSEKQVALFSATMPAQIKKITKEYLDSPAEISIKAESSTVDRIEQSYWLAKGSSKIEALCRILDVRELNGLDDESAESRESNKKDKVDTSGVVVFVRTKANTVEVAEKLEARGWLAAAINGDMNQQLRERTIDKIKDGSIDVLVATDVAARGIDVRRIGLVVNFDMPYDSETYVHRIGRTGRAGRSGKAILFVTPRERYLLRQIEKNTRQKIKSEPLPSQRDVMLAREQAFKINLANTLKSKDLGYFKKLVADIQHETGANPEDTAAALAFLAQLSKPLRAEDRKSTDGKRDSKKDSKRSKDRDERSSRNKHDRRNDRKADRKTETQADTQRRTNRTNDDVLESFNPQAISIKDESGETVDMERFHLSVGIEHGASPKDIVGAISNEAGISGKFIGKIRLFDTESTVDLPAGMPKEVFNHLRKTRVRQQALSIQRISPKGELSGDAAKSKGLPSFDDNDFDGDRKPRKSKKTSKPAKSVNVKSGRDKSPRKETNKTTSSKPKNPKR